MCLGPPPPHSRLPYYDACRRRVPRGKVIEKRSEDDYYKENIEEYIKNRLM
jgi:hypothetical protein